MVTFATDISIMWKMREVQNKGLMGPDGKSSYFLFQNKIPSIQVAVSLPPPGTYLSKYDKTSQGVESGKVTPNHVSVSAADIGLPDGGLPPQGAGQPSLPTESFGFPDGVVPPQYSGQAPVPSQSQVQAAQYPISTQPLDLSALGVPNSVDSGKPLPQTAAQPTSVHPGQVPRGAAAPVCFKIGLAHLEQNQLPDALSCFDEVFLALAKDQSRGADIKAQATICAQYKIAVTLLREITRLQKVQGASAISAKDEMARLSRHSVSLPLQTKHHINCIRAAIRRNMEVQNYAYFKQMLELLLLKVPASFQEELRSLSLTNKSIDPLEDPSQFCAATLSCMSTIDMMSVICAGQNFPLFQHLDALSVVWEALKDQMHLLGLFPPPHHLAEVEHGQFCITNQRYFPDKMVVHVVEFLPPQSCHCYVIHHSRIVLCAGHTCFIEEDSSTHWKPSENTFTRHNLSSASHTPYIQSNTNNCHRSGDCDPHQSSFNTINIANSLHQATPVINPPAPITVPGGGANSVTTYPAPTGNVPVVAPPATTNNVPAIPGQSWCVAVVGDLGL
ncbi:hypothetical protein EZV62_013834 [Acer yangbiense]|uniref:Uncharacterized protein n=1 Tax=Acer yangbiense TaxID=1000413 RepID=A0A5C7HQD6_9ROSI|nr:hypothetical protein EZV62_013834 [Acer yangbiense]